MKYEIQVYNDGEQLSDARNPSVLLMSIEVDARSCHIQDFLILCRKVRSIWPESHYIHLFASETSEVSKKIDWNE